MLGIGNEKRTPAFPDLPAIAEVLVPFVQEIVTDVDLLEGTVTIDPPGGLFDDIEE